jgi:hypothetical protein
MSRRSEAKSGQRAKAPDLRGGDQVAEEIGAHGNRYTDQCALVQYGSERGKQRARPGNQHLVDRLVAQ